MMSTTEKTCVLIGRSRSLGYRQTQTVTLSLFDHSAHEELNT